MKLLIVSTDPTIREWKSLPDKLWDIRTALQGTPNAAWNVEVVHRDVHPEINDRFRIDHEWYNRFSYPLFREGNHLVYLHMSAAQWVGLRLDRRLRGANQIDDDFVGESYGWSDEHTKRGRSKQSQFVQNVLHECSHELARACGVPDKTHEYHDENPDISGIFRSYNMLHWQPVYRQGLKTQVSLLQRIVALLTPAEYRRPLAFGMWEKVTNRYGVYNPVFYPSTKHHIGVDFATPIGTPIFAPEKGKVTRSGYLERSLGHWCEYKVNNDFFIFCHLERAALPGPREKGWVIGFTGNTGLSTGPHLHVELWNQPMNRSLLNELTWRDLTSDVTKIIQ